MFIHTLKPRLHSLFLSFLNYFLLVLVVFLAVTPLASCNGEEKVRALCSVQRHMQQRRATRTGSTASFTCSNSENNRCVDPRGSWFVDPDGRPHAYFFPVQFSLSHSHSSCSIDRVKASVAYWYIRFP